MHAEANGAAMIERDVGTDEAPSIAAQGYNHPKVSLLNLHLFQCLCIACFAFQTSNLYCFHFVIVVPLSNGFISFSHCAFVLLVGRMNLLSLMLPTFLYAVPVDVLRYRVLQAWMCCSQLSLDIMP